jgi:hypothetical protein
MKHTRLALAFLIMAAVMPTNASAADAEGDALGGRIVVEVTQLGYSEDVGKALVEMAGEWKAEDGAPALASLKAALDAARGKTGAESTAEQRIELAKVEAAVAKQLALKGCGSGCKVFWTTQDKCVAYAHSTKGGYWYAAGGAPTDQQARQNALKFCQSGSAPPNSCVIAAAECR